MSDNDDENDLPEHTLSMRAALRHCTTLIDNICEETSCRHVSVRRTTIESIESLDAKRQDAYNSFWARQHNLEEEDTPISMLSSLETLTPRKFREDYHFRNLPCLIQYDELPTHSNPFEHVATEWRTKNRQHINLKWFLDHLGAETLVPLRYHATDECTKLDSEGRAAECDTREVTLTEWIETLSKKHQDQRFYLKDWHLVALLRQKGYCIPLYTCPEIFEHDLLNPFLTEFTNGDYQFCYWGPKGSKTLRHSDVLHSFSWSYNVHGTKKWTFYGGKDCSQQFTVIQEAGHAMFVPCTWQHEVVNLEETISINHNWITVANIDRTFDCLMVELKEIHCELEKWGIFDTDENFLEASESMLRGCVGLNMTSFFLLLLWRLSRLLKMASDGQINENDEDSGEHEFECCRISRLIQRIMRDVELQIEGRVKAVTLSMDLALEAMRVARTAVNFVSEE